MKKIFLCITVVLLILISFIILLEKEKFMPAMTVSGQERTGIRLPQPRYESAISIEQALRERKSTRTYRKDTLSLEEISQLLWAAQGITHGQNLRTAPSAGALYPLETYIVAVQVQNLPPGVYRYTPSNHQLLLVLPGDKRGELWGAALHQEAIRDAPAVIVISAVFARSTGKYGKRGIRYSHMEAGSVAQNVALQAVSLNLGTVVIGAFADEMVQKALSMPPEEEPLLVMPVGRK